MNINDARVLALNGAMLAEGCFEFEGADASDLLQPQNALIAIHDRPGQGTEFALAGNARRDADGLWSADWPVHSVAFKPAVPPLDQLLDFPSFALSSEGVPSNSVRFDLAAEHSAFAWVALNTVYGAERRVESVLGNAAAVSMEIMRDADGFAIMIEARLDAPKRGDRQLAPITVRVRAKLSFETIALAGSRLWWRGGAERWDHQGQDSSGPLSDVLTLGRAGGTPFFKGTLELGPNLPEIYRGTWVEAQSFGRRLILRPQREPKRLPGGFYGGNSGGVQLVLHNLGQECWKELLGEKDEAVLIQSGDGIGFSQRVTGRDVGDEGPHEQPITMMRTRLSRQRDGLAISLVGELGPYSQRNPRYPPLGPDFGVEFFVPRTLLLARGLILGDMYQERRREIEAG